MGKTLTHKLWMAATGAFLCFFLVIHLLGNLQLLLPLPDAQLKFNWYSHLLSGNIIIKVISYILYFSILAHVFYALIITWKNKRANGRKYRHDRRGAASTWQSRNMGLLGTIILIFLIIHFKDFWYQYKFTTVPVDEKGNKDLYTIVVTVYKQWWYVVIYEVSLIALGFHLLHGFYSAARTFGLYHPKYVKWVKVAGWLYAAAITFGFMAMPIYVYLKNV
jgi:succinate dehydrogenase / fumarate reductase cytochrome b subunit